MTLKNIKKYLEKIPKNILKKYQKISWKNTKKYVEKTKVSNVISKIIDHEYSIFEPWKKLSELKYQTKSFDFEILVVKRRPFLVAPVILDTHW